MPTKTQKEILDFLDADQKAAMQRSRPLMPGSTGTLRARLGWHQTWLWNDQLPWAKSVGYKEIRVPRFKKDAQGAETSELELPGQESGEFIDRIEGADSRKFLRAMEIPEVIHDKHNQDVSRLSHQAYSSPEWIAKEELNGLNRDLGGSMEQVTAFSERIEEREGIELVEDSPLGE